MYDEAKNAECAREMMLRHDWIVPTFNGELRTDKPPLHYFFMKAGYSIFGINELGARFFSAVAGIGLVLLVFYFVKRFSSARHAFLSSLVLLASTHFLFEFRIAVPDPYLLLFNTLAILSGFAWILEKKIKWLIICSVALGAGVLSKGPVGLALPCLILFLWMLWEKKLKELWDWRHLAAIFIVAVIAVPWFILVHQATGGEYTNGFFINHNLNRFSSTKEGHGGIFFLIPLFVFAGMLPASIYSGGLIKKIKDFTPHPLARLSVTAVLAIVIFYSFSQTKLPNYPMPSYPFLAVLLGGFLDRVITQNKKSRYPFILLAIIYTAVTFLAYTGLKQEVNTRGSEAISVFLLILTAGALSALFFLNRKGIKTALILLFVFITVFNLLFFNYLHPLIYRNTPVAGMLPYLKEQKEVVAYKNFHPSFVFYTSAPVRKFEDSTSLADYLKNHQVFIITRKDREAELKDLPLQEVLSIHDLFEKPTTLLLTNK